MLQTLDLSVYASRNEKAILKAVNFYARLGELVAIVGPSGCGKSTFLRAIAGFTNHTTGQIRWLNHEIGQDYDIYPEMLAYIPQFGIFHEQLKVREILTDAAILRLGNFRNIASRVEVVAELTALSSLLNREANILSGGQKRKLALAMELVSSPLLILADEVTSGLDPKSSSEITDLLRNLASKEGRIVLQVTHELKHIHCYDSVFVLDEGAVAFQGTPEEMTSYFQISDPEDLFQRLSQFSSQHGKSRLPRCVPLEDKSKYHALEIKKSLKQQSIKRWAVQFLYLIRRRFRLFVRNKSQIYLQTLLIFVFPGIVVLFALRGLPEIKNMNLNFETNPSHILKETLDFSSQEVTVAKLVSGLAMFQVILLALMGANNSAREIATERGIFEKEKLSGLNTTAYLASKLQFLCCLVLAQSLWMTLLVKGICDLPGSFWEQLIILGLVNFSLTCLSLAISSWSKTAEQASLIALYVVGFQLPLSGAVLALPDWLSTITRPFIAAYWSWSGYLQTLKDTRLYDVVTFAGSATLDPFMLCAIVLVGQSLACLSAAYLGCYRSDLSD